MKILSNDKMQVSNARFFFTNAGFKSKFFFTEFKMQIFFFLTKSFKIFDLK
jgi:hypothetical protein